MSIYYSKDAIRDGNKEDILSDMRVYNFIRSKQAEKEVEEIHKAKEQE